MSMISAKGQEHVKIEAKIPEDIDIAFKKYLWLLDMTLDEGIRQAILHYMEYLEEQVSETISELVFQVLAPQLLSYINSTIVTRDGEQLSSQQAFERAIKEDK